MGTFTRLSTGEIIKPRSTAATGQDVGRPHPSQPAAVPPSPKGEGFAPAGGTGAAAGEAARPSVGGIANGAVDAALRSILSGGPAASTDIWTRGSQYSGVGSSGLNEAREDRLRQLEARRSELTAGLDLEGAAALDNEISSLRKQLGRTLPQQTIKTVSGMLKAIPAGLEGAAGSMANAWTSFYQGGQGGRDARNRETLREYTAGLDQSRRRLASMLEDNARAPGTWGEGDIRSQQNLVNDWQRKYDAMSKVIDEDIQQQATQESYKAADTLSADSARRMEEAKEGLLLPGQVMVDATGSFVQNVADMGVNTLMGTPGSMGTFAMRAFGGGAQQARQEMEAMGTAGQEGAYTKQTVYGLASMAKEIATEKILNLSAPFGAAYGKGSIDDITQRAIDRAASRFARTAAGKRALERGLNFVNSAASEGLEELIGDWIEWQLPNIYGGEIKSAKEVLENSVYDFMVGAASGGLGDVAFRGANRALDAAAGNTARLLEQAAQEAAQNGKTTNNTAAQILADEAARSVLEAGAGLTITEDMTKSQQRAAVKEAVGRLSTAPESTQTEGRGITLPDIQERTEARRAYDIGRIQRASSTLGENGRKAMTATYDGQTDAGRYYGGFAVYYQAGISGKDLNKVSGDYSGVLTPAQQFAAYASGQNDAAASLEREKQAARFAPMAGEESGLVYDDFVREAVESGRTLTDANWESITDTNGETRAYLSAGTAERINTLARDLGVRVRFVDVVDRNTNANAQIDGSEILVERNNENPVMAIVGHELTHRMQQLAPEAYREFRDLVMQDQKFEGEVQKKIDNAAKWGVTLDTEGAMDEIAADAAGLLMDDGQVLDDFIRRNQDNRTVLEKLRDAFRALWQKLTGKEKQKAGEAEKKLTAALEAAVAQAEQNSKNAAQTEDGGVRYSINEQFGQEIQEWSEEGRPEGERFVLGSTGPVLQGLGAIESDIYMNGDKISTILKQHPEMTIREIQRIPDILEDPVLVLKSRNVGGSARNSRMVMFGSVKAQDGL